MNEINYHKLVADTLNENWTTHYQQPLRMNVDDLVTGVVLLTKIAVETIFDELGANLDPTGRQFFVEISPSDKVIEKIKEFVETKAHTFRRACQAGFPFSLVENSLAEKALSHSLQNYDTLLSYFIGLGDGDLDPHLSDAALERLQPFAIVKACGDFASAYFNNLDYKAGYSLLWLIKKAAGCSFDLPKIDDFTCNTVTEVLSQFLKNSPLSLTNPLRFSEILIFFYPHLLDEQASLIFKSCVEEQLQMISLENWPNKLDILLEFFKRSENKLAFAEKLASNQDELIAKAGYHFSKALTASSLYEAAPHFYELMELLSGLKRRDAIGELFGHPFIEFCKDKTSWNDPSFSKRLNFNDKKEVFVSGSLMMGVHKHPLKDTFPPYLFAFDLNTEKIVWGIPLQPKLYQIHQVGDYLTLQFLEEKQVYFVDQKTGFTAFTLELPENFNDHRLKEFHISPEGYAYQMVYKNQKRHLLGGQIIEGKWHPSFECSTPRGVFHPRSTHCGFEEPLAGSFILIGPSGHSVSLEGCMAVLAMDDKLYCIEKDPCRLTIRTLKMDQEVISSIEKEIPLDVEEASFGEICQNGNALLFSNKKSPIFLNLNTEEVIYSQFKLSPNAKYVINKNSGELWVRDSLSEEVWKISSHHTLQMGLLKNGSAPLYADNQDQLYF